MRLAIYGAGSLGTVLGAYLSMKGAAVDLISRNRAHIKALQDRGAHIVGAEEFTQSVHALLPEELEGTYDIIFLLTKQQENRAVARFLTDYLSPDGMLCSLQNGLPETELIEILGENRVSGCTVGWGATLLESGTVELTSNSDTFSFNLGCSSSKGEARLKEIESLLSLMGQVTIEDNFIGARWSKLLINAAFSGTATLFGTTFGGVASDRKMRRVAQLVLKETLDTAKAASVTIEPVQGKDIVSLFDYHTKIKQKISFFLIPFALSKHRDLKPSMLQDIEKGKPCEIDAINGVLSREGKAVGVATPVNDLIVELIHRIESKDLEPGKEHIVFFESYLS